jgi:hypothetical protein
MLFGGIWRVLMKHYDGYKYKENTRFHKWGKLDKETRRKRIYEWVKTHAICRGEFDFYVDELIIRECKIPTHEEIVRGVDK